MRQQIISKKRPSIKFNTVRRIHTPLANKCPCVRKKEARTKERKSKRGFFGGGKSSGKIVPDGTYFYLIKALGADDKEHLLKGSFSLIR